MSGTFWSSKMFSSFVPQLKNANCLDPGFLLGAAPTGTSSQWDLVPVGAKGLGRTVNWRKCVVIKHLQGGHGGSIGHDPPPTSRSNRQVVQALMAPQSITPPNGQGTHWGLHPAFVFQSITNNCEKPSDCLVFLLRGRSSHRTLVTWQTCHDPSLRH